MDSANPRCPKCGGEMAFYSSETFSKHYVCMKCNEFLRVPRLPEFYSKSPFKPKIYG